MFITTILSINIYVLFTKLFQMYLWTFKSSRYNTTVSKTLKNNKQMGGEMVNSFDLVPGVKS